jgi:dTDP-glucose pyrophosphorylase/transcriptional regulator with XRE-family HTH domain
MALLNTTSIGVFLRVLRTTHGKKQIEMKGLLERAAGKSLDLSDSTVSQIENGNTAMRAEIFNAMLLAFELTPEEVRHARKLYSNQGTDGVAGSRDLFAPMVDRLSKSWDGLAPRDQATIYQRIDAMLDSYDDGQDGAVTWAVIPVAGWQSALASAETAKLVVPCIEEALACSSIVHFLLIRNRRHADLVDDVKRFLRGRRPRSLEIVDEVQDKKEGLGKAVQLAASHHGVAAQQAFALLLPDDHLESECLQTLVRLHRKAGGTVVALKRARAKEIYSGVAWSEDKGDAIRLRGLSERPRDPAPLPHYSVLGRYIIDRKVIAALDDIPKNESTNRYELTDALNKVAESQLTDVLGYVYHGRINSIRDPRIELLNKIATMYDQPLCSNKAKVAIS